MCIHFYPDIPEDNSLEDIYEMGHFTYFAQFENLAEHEIDHVYFTTKSKGKKIIAVDKAPMN